MTKWIIENHKTLSGHFNFVKDEFVGSYMKGSGETPIVMYGENPVERITTGIEIIRLNPIITAIKIAIRFLFVILEY